MSDGSSVTMTEDGESGGNPISNPTYKGTAGQISRIVLVNALLSLLTLGIYRFWGKTRLRRHLWSSISFQGDRFEYTGTAKELFIGFLIALTVLVPLGVFANFADLISPVDIISTVQIIQLVSAIIFLFLIQFAIYRARRYRLTRTTWRGIRGGQTGSAVRYALISMGHFVLLGLSLGLTMAWMNTTLERIKMNNTWLGDRKFSFDGSAGKLFKSWFFAWLLFIPTLGFSLAWYKVAEWRYFTKSTKYENLHFELNARGGQLFKIQILFLLAMLGVTIVVAMISIGAIVIGTAVQGGGGGASLYTSGPGVIPLIPVVVTIMFFISSGVLSAVMIIHPLARLMTNNLSVIGEQDFTAITQSSRAIPGSAEGLMDALDVGGI